MDQGEEQRTRLRVALYEGDGTGVIAALAPVLPNDAQQLVGDGLLLALAQRVDEAVTLAGRCTDALRVRDWQGDHELADQLQAALELRPEPPLRSLPVDLEELAGVLEGDPVQGDGRIDIRTGEVWPQAAIDYAKATGDEDFDSEDAERWLDVLCEGSRAGYRDMEDFIDTIANDALAEQLAHAIVGRGAFHRFKDTLARRPDELERYYGFSNERQRGRACAWLASAGYRPSTPMDTDQTEP